MASHDWIVIGNGLAGAALSYELQKSGYSVLLLEQSAQPQSASRYSYGGIAYWAGTTPLMQQLCREGIALHRQLTDELEADTQFRELALLLTVAPDRDPVQAATTYAQCDVAPSVLDAAAACEYEPLLNPVALSGALYFRHGHVCPEATVAAYNRAFLHLGGTIELAPVIGWVQQGLQIQGVITPSDTFRAQTTVVCAGAMTRTLLRTVGISVPLYFTQAELIETPPVELRLQTLIMPAELQRFGMEARAAQAKSNWDQPGQEIAPAILDAGVVQFQDGRLRIGQISRFVTDLNSLVDVTASEQALRQSIEPLLPTLQSVPGQWCRCQVAFSGDRLPLVGTVPDLVGLRIFTGFSNPFAILPPLARRFAQATETSDPLLAQLSPHRFR
jgi:glycine/D-amino acid oxidase-like deaminating enzyme